MNRNPNVFRMGFVVCVYAIRQPPKPGSPEDERLFFPQYLDPSTLFINFDQGNVLDPKLGASNAGLPFKPLYIPQRRPTP
jgi:hypothetical protein